MPFVRQVRTEAELSELVDRMPDDVGLRLLDLAEGKPVLPPAPLKPNASTEEIEATSTQLVVVHTERQLKSILNQPLAKWIAFLHPEQKMLVSFESKGSTKVTGSAGTGKTVVAMHRARHLASRGQRVLVTSFTQTICQNIERNLRLICTNEEMFNIAVIHVHKLAQAVLREANDRWSPVKEEVIAEMIAAIHPGESCPLEPPQVLVEFQQIIEPQTITSWNEYRGASRAGRGRALTVKERKEVWTVLEQLLQQLEKNRQASWQGICRQAAAHLPPLTAKRASWRYDQAAGAPLSRPARAGEEPLPRRGCRPADLPWARLPQFDRDRCPRPVERAADQLSDHRADPPICRSVSGG
ncbi:MAG: hypothetical protein EBZ36_14980 [Acidobacteria bacterium]|nr:hypothetical protein [Acidobacteriota bacterium]